MKKTMIYWKSVYLLFLLVLASGFQRAGAVSPEEMQLDSVIQYNNNIGENSRYLKTEYTYDLNQNPVLKITYVWTAANDGTYFWMYSRKEEMTYDDRNRIETEKMYVWNAFSGIWMGSDRNYKRYFYYPDSDRTEQLYYYLWDGSAWRDQYYKSEFTYGEDGTCIEIMYKDLNGTGWEPAEKRESVYDENGNLITLIYYTMSIMTQSWQPSDKDVYTYDGRGNVLTYTKYLYLLGDWMEGENYKLKHEYIYDENGDIISDVTMRWNSGAWQQDTHYAYEYFYSEVSTNVKVLPYYESFDKESVLTDDYTLWDSEGDGVTAWSWNAGSEDLKCAQAVADDYLFTPALHLPVTHRYEVTFKARCDNTAASGRLKAIVCTAANPDQALAVILDEQDISHTEYQTFKGTFLVPQQANYYIGFCACTADGSAVYLDDVSVEPEKPVSVPDKVINLGAWPAAGGVNQVTLMFLIPTTSLDGMLINGVNGYVIMRDDLTEPVYKSETFQIRGDVISWTDENAKEGENTYTVYTYNEFGNSDEVSVKVIVGVDYPGKIRNFRADEISSGVCQLTWEAPDKTATGKPISPDGITYRVYRYLGTADELIGEVSEPAYTDSGITVGSTQVPVQYSVSAVNRAGEGLKTSTDVLLLGDPYTLPFTESFAGCAFQNYVWTTIGIIGANSWGFADNGINPDVIPQDNDGGMMAFTTLQFLPGNMSRLTSPKIGIGQAEKPVLDFWMAHSTNADGITVAGDDALVIRVSADNETYETLDSIFVKSDRDGWIKHSYSLDAYKGCSHIRLGFVGVVGRTNNIYLDNITVSNAGGSSVSASGRKQVKVYGTDEAILIEGVEEGPVSVYAIDGRLIYSEEVLKSNIIPVQKGLYLVSVGGRKAVKVAVR